MGCSCLLGPVFAPVQSGKNCSFCRPPLRVRSKAQAGQTALKAAASSHGARPQRDAFFEWNEVPDSSRQQKGAARQQRSAAGQRRQLNHRERVSIAIETNHELGALQAEAVRLAFPPGGSDLEQQRQALQQLTDSYQTLLTNRGSFMDAVNIATLLHHLSAALTHAEADYAMPQLVRWQRVVAHAIHLAHSKVRDFKLPEVHMSLWGLAKLGYPLQDFPPGFLDAMATRVMQRLREPPAVDVMNLTNLLWACARLGCSPLEGELLHAAVSLAAPRVDEMSPQNLCNLVWAAVVLNEAPSMPVSTWEDVARHCMLKMPEMPVQSVSNLMWAYAKMGLSPQQGDFMRVACNRVSEVQADMSLLQVSVILWSLATLRHHPGPRLLERLGMSFWQRLGPGVPTQQLSMALWSLGRLNESPLNGKLARDITSQALSRVSELREQELANILWSVASLRRKCPMEQFAARLDSEYAQASLALWQGGRQDPAELQHMANSVWAFAQLGLDPLNGRLFDWVLQAVLHQLQLRRSAAGNLHRLASIVLAHGIMQHAIPGKHVQTLVDLLCRDSEASHGQEMCNIVWGLAALQQLVPEDLRRVTDRMAELSMDLKQIELRQLQQADMLVKGKQGVSLHEGQPFISPTLAPSVYSIRHQVNDYDPSRLHEDVAKVLSELGVPHELEVTSNDGFFCFDIVAQVNGQDIVVEVDGNTHFSALPPHRALGGTYIRNTLFAAAGHKGIAIAYFQWERLGTQEARRNYVQRRLLQHAKQHTSPLVV